MARTLWAPEIAARSYDGLVAVAQRVQLAVGAVALAGVWLLDGVPTSDKAVVTGLLLLVYLPWSLLSPHLSRAAPRAVNLAIDLLAIGVFPLVIAETRVAVMAAYVLMVAFHAYASGRLVGLVVVAGVLVVTAVAEVLAPSAERLDAFTLLMYATTLVAFTVMLDGLAAERRRLVRHLSRLNDALGAMSPEPALDGTLRSVARAAAEAVDASFVAVLLVRDRHIDAESQFLSRDVEPTRDVDDEVRAALAAIVEEPELAPSGVAIKAMRAVSVADIATDRRFSTWRPVAEAFDIRALVAVPLVHAGECLGVLTAYAAVPSAFSDEDVALLEAYAEQATLAVVRAMAFDREQKAATRLADADRMKSEFVARVSHELRTPLTAINGFISTVLLRWDQLDDAGRKELLTRAARNTLDLRRLVEQVLAFARTGEENAVIAADPLPLAAEVDNVLEHLLPVIGDHDVDVEVHPAIVVHADREALRHVLTNLLSNAAKFSPDGAPIHVRARPMKGEVEVSVRDEGPGIAEDEQERIFERFYRSSSVSARGTGIGLSIVESFVAQMGGRVWVESTPGEGATFRFTLPAGDPGRRRLVRS